MSNLSQYTDLIVHLVEKMLLLTEKLGTVSYSFRIRIGGIRIRNDLFRILIRIRQKVPDPTGLRIHNTDGTVLFLF